MTLPHPNVQALIEVAEGLEDLRDEVVFLGGATVALLLTDPGAHHVRVTKDVDCIVEVASLLEYHRLDERLRARGFVTDAGGVICRYRLGERILDVMPTVDAILGFANRWSRQAILGASPYELRAGLTARIVAPMHLLATKLEAFKARGRQDMLISHDLEDIVLLVDGRPELVEEARSQAPADLRQYLRETFDDLFADGLFLEALAGHLPPDDASQARLPVLQARLDALRRLASP